MCTQKKPIINFELTLIKSKGGGNIKKYIFITGLIFFMLGNFFSNAVLSEESIEYDDDPNKTAIAETITEFINSIIYQDKENVMKWFSPEATDLRNEAEKEKNAVEKLIDFSCGNLKVLSFEYPNPNTLNFKFAMECNGFDSGNSKDVNRKIAKTVTLNRDESNNSWKIIYFQDIAPSKSPSAK